MTDLQLARAGPDNILTFDLLGAAGRIRGVPQLVQEVVVELMSRHDPATGRGSGLLEALAGVDTQNLAGARQTAAEAVRFVVGLLRTRQEANPALTADERLADLQLLDVRAGPGLSWQIDLELTPARGRPVVFSVPEAA